MLYNQGGAIYGGHGGAMAGHLAGVYIDRKTQIGAAALTNSGTRGDMDAFAITLAAKATELWPEPIEPWRPEQEPPAEVRALLGRWWSEGNEFVFWWEGGTLQREGRRHAARPRRDDVRARRRRLARGRAAASAASVCASTATSWSGRATRSRARRSRSKA